MAITRIHDTTNLCYCDGRYPGCDHPPFCDKRVDGSRSRYWCRACDERRCAHITANLEAARAELTP